MQVMTKLLNKTSSTMKEIPDEKIIQGGLQPNWRQTPEYVLHLIYHVWTLELEEVVQLPLYAALP
jgi:hypothetical protein